MARKTLTKKESKSKRSRKRVTHASKTAPGKPQYSEMHELTGSREDVLKLMKDTIQQLGQDKPTTKKAGMRSLGIKSARQWTTERDQLLDTLKRGYDNEQPKAAARALGVTAVPNERAVDTWYAPRNRVVAIFQSAMDEYLDELDQKRAKKSRRGVSLTAQTPAKPTLADFYKPTAKERALRLIEQYSNLDPRWVEVVWAKAKLLFKGKRKFISHSSTTDFRFSMNDETTVAIVGDWGGGNAAAQAVAEQIRKIKPGHVIHLGDVYYAGTEKEVQDRFLRFWPPSSGGQSFALNSNHEMYSGGYGYFNVTLKQFRQPASYFSLANHNWRFIGLDTGYVDHDLNKEQVDWLTAQFKGSNPKTILLTHHQLFSAYEKTDASNLQARVQPLLDAGKIYGWIWGHEHLCVVYQKHMGINAVCLGNGCFPYNAPTGDPKVPVTWMNDRAQAGDGDYRGVHTFALLTIRGPQIDVQYIDQDGHVGFQQTWT